MVEQRQIAERQRQLGNAAFKAGQYSEALRCYEAGLEMQRHNMTLHANAAMAALKLRCYVAAQEHCDKVCVTVLPALGTQAGLAAAGFICYQSWAGTQGTHSHVQSYIFSAMQMYPTPLHPGSIPGMLL